MRIHNYHGQYITTHSDERPRPDTYGPQLFPGIIVAPVLLAIAILVVWAMIHASRTPEHPASAPVIGLGVTAVTLIVLGGLRVMRRGR